MTELTTFETGREGTSIVDRALGLLEEDERELIIQMHYLGRSYEEIARRSGRQTHRLAALHKRAFQKLRWWLGAHVEETYGIVNRRPACPICDSAHRKEIDRIIASRDKSLTWKPVLARVREQFGLIFRNPQLLMSHERFHMISLSDIDLKGGL